MSLRRGLQIIRCAGWYAVGRLSTGRQQSLGQWVRKGALETELARLTPKTKLNPVGLCWRSVGRMGRGSWRGPGELEDFEAPRSSSLLPLVVLEFVAHDGKIARFLTAGSNISNRRMAPFMSTTKHHRFERPKTLNMIRQWTRDTTAVITKPSLEITNDDGSTRKTRKRKYTKHQQIQQGEAKNNCVHLLRKPPRYLFKSTL
jgi:hypothetical protein